MGASNREVHDQIDGPAHPVPIFGLNAQLPVTCLGQGIVLGSPIILGEPPFRMDPTLGLHPVTGRVERSLFNLERRLRRLVNPAHYRKAVHRARDQST